MHDGEENLAIAVDAHARVGGAKINANDVVLVLCLHPAQGKPKGSVNGYQTKLKLH